MVLLLRLCYRLLLLLLSRRRRFKELHLLHCLSEGTGSESAALLSLIPSLPDQLAQSSDMATAERRLLLPLLPASIWDSSVGFHFYLFLHIRDVDVKTFPPSCRDVTDDCVRGLCGFKPRLFHRLGKNRAAESCLHVCLLKEEWFN